MRHHALASSTLVAAVLGWLSTHCGPAPQPAASPPPPASVSAGAQAPAPEKPPETPGLSPADIDAMVRAEWQKAGVEPSPRVDDARFFRRAHLDILGVIPSPEEVEGFLKETAPDKREKAVAAMLASDRYAERWTNYWDRMLLGRDVRAQLVDRPAFRAWLGERFAKNEGWDKVVYGLLTATGQNRAGEGEGPEKVNGAVNWLLRYQQTPADLTGATSRVFLGVQIQCAQCHDHKTEKWKTDDFKHLAACFVQTKVEQIDRDGKQRRVELKDLDKVPRGNPKRAMAMADFASSSPSALDGTDFSSSPNRRQALAAWITAPQNPWFSRAIVNRIWAQMLGHGFTDPVDDIRESNPPAAPELWAKLAEDFTSHGHDLKRLIGQIAATEAYQRASSTPKAKEPAKGSQELRLWARFRPSPMGPDELVDSLVAATKIDALLGKGDAEKIEQAKMQMRRQFSFLFDVDEEASDDDQFDGTIPQVLMLLNGRLTNAGASAAPGGALAEILALPGDEARVRALYLRTLSREPSADEAQRAVAFVNAPREIAQPRPDQAPPAPEPKGKKGGGGKKGPGKDPLAKLDNKRPRAGGDPKKQAYEDLFWALLNSSEFVFNR